MAVDVRLTATASRALPVTEVFALVRVKKVDQQQNGLENIRVEVMLLPGEPALTIAWGILIAHSALVAEPPVTQIALPVLPKEVVTQEVVTTITNAKLVNAATMVDV